MKINMTFELSLTREVTEEELTELFKCKYSFRDDDYLKAGIHWFDTLLSEKQYSILDMFDADEVEVKRRFLDIKR